MSGQPSSAPAASSGATGIASGIGSMFSSVSSKNSTNYIVIISMIISIILFIVSFVSMSKFVGDKDNWNAIQSQISTVLAHIIPGTVLLFIAVFLYFNQDPSKNLYFTLIVSCLSLGLSYAALAIAAISR
jgi:hypothetical protein